MTRTKQTARKSTEAKFMDAREHNRNSVSRETLKRRKNRNIINLIKKTRSPRTTSIQYMKMLDFLSLNKDLAKGKSKLLYGKEITEKRWAELTIELNNIGPQKTSKQWKVVWRDAKSRALKKARNLRAIENKHSSKLSEMELRIIKIIDEKYIEENKDCNIPEKEGQKCGYCGYFLPQNFNLLDHSCFQPFVEGMDTLVVDENFVVTVMSTTEEHGNTLPLAASNDKPTSNVDVAAQEMSSDELLITCVAQKPALFDHRIPANERRVISAVEAKNRWRYLRDCYSKAKKKENEYIPSGSGAEELLKRKNPFRFNQQMAFLDDVILGKSPTCSSLTINTPSTNNETRDTASNEPAILVPLSLSSGGSNISDSNISDDAIISTKKKKLNRSKDQNFEDSIVAALRDPKETDAIDGFFNNAGRRTTKTALQRDCIHDADKIYVTGYGKARGTGILLVFVISSFLIGLFLKNIEFQIM